MKEKIDSAWSWVRVGRWSVEVDRGGVAWVVAEDQQRRTDVKEKTKTKNENVISTFSFFVQILKTFL